MVQCVYKISCVDENIKEFYIGSTDNLKDRITNHMEFYNKQPKNQGLLYKFMKENGGISNFQINPIEIFSFLTKEELKKHEQFYLDEYKPQLNTNRAFGIDIEKRKNIVKKHNNVKANCPHCNFEMLKRSIKRHIKRIHTTPT